MIGKIDLDIEQKDLKLDETGQLKSHATSRVIPLFAARTFFFR
jgi:hypothetical protein